ncbi:MAG TPA: ATP-binding protein [Actinomycetota bacterium]|nr:ATP-binding protein [Actinomycetota bacterium]
MTAEPDRAKRTLWAGILVYRWAALAWMAVLTLAIGEPYRRPELAWASVGAAAAWSAWLTVSRSQEQRGARWFDLALASGLILVSGLVVAPGNVGERPFFAAAYPITAALSWGAARGPVGGLSAGLALAAAYVLARPVNDIPLDALGGGEFQGVANGAINYLLAGGAVGVVARLLDRSAAEVRVATEEAMAARERAARLAEREAMARTIHDSVLQALALINKRGRELASAGTVPGPDVGRLAEMAGQQERDLRGLILREPAEPPGGMASLREALEAVGREATGPPVTVTAVGPIWLPAPAVDELAAAVRQALENVARHAGASKAAVYAELDGAEAVVSIRDDGRGFTYDEERLRSDGKLGILKSMKGRVEDLGGSLRIDAMPGRGTEVELRLPVGSPR